MAVCVWVLYLDIDTWGAGVAGALAPFLAGFTGNPGRGAVAIPRCARLHHVYYDHPVAGQPRIVAVYGALLWSCA